MDKTSIRDIYQTPASFSEQTICIAGWVRTVRASNAFGFIELNDGSCFKGIQIVMEADKLPNYAEAAKINVGAAIIVTGRLVLTPDAPQPFELKADTLAIEGASTPDYPLQKKKHSMEYLRTIAHLRARTNTFSAAFRVRSEAAFAIHQFFNERGFVYVHTPLITGSDCEGAGEMFRVTTLDFDEVPRTEDGKVDFSQDFFGHSTSLTVSGQLEGETMAMAFGKIYTFGPTFRAEHSNTQRHAAEFWMIEPEIAFADLEDNMKLADDMLRYVVKHLLTKCSQELEFFNKFFDKGLIERLEKLLATPSAHLTYTEAIKVLEHRKTALNILYTGAATFKPNMNASSPKSMPTARSSSRIIRRRSNPSICARMTTARPLQQWICWCPASAKSSAAAREKSGWICWKNAWKNSAWTKRITGGI